MSKRAITRMQAVIIIVVIAIGGFATYYLFFGENEPPKAVATVAMPSVEQGKAIQFSGADSTDDGSIDSYDWDFGDGKTGEGKTISHTYTTAGTYIIVLTVTDDDGATDTNDDELLFLDVTPTPATPTLESPPTAKIAVDNDVLETGDEIFVDGSSSTGWYDYRGAITPTSGDIASWDWDFGDGTTASGKTATKTYDTPGSYPIKLTVTSTATGMTDSIYRTVRVVAPGTIAEVVKNKDTFTFAATITLKAGVIDPVMQTGSPGRNLLLALTDTLVWYSPGAGEPEALLAESWDVSDDFKQYTFKLREGVTFWNGDEVTAEDVQYSIHRFIAMNIAGTWCDRIVFPLTGYMTGQYVPDAVRENAVKVLDKYTVQFNLVKPFAPFLDALAIPIFGVVSKAYAMERGSYTPGANWTNVRDPGMDSGENLMGSGPYQLIELIPNERIEMLRYDDYWKGPASIKRVVWLEIQEWSTRQILLMNGDIDATTGEPSQVAIVEDEPGISVSALSDGMNEAIYFGLDRDPDLQPAGTQMRMDMMNDVHARRGFAYAFPYDDYLEQAWLGMVGRAYGNIMPQYLGGEEFQTDLVYDPAKAEEEFKLAWGGEIWEDGFTIAFGYQPWMAEAGLIMADLMRESLYNINPKFDIIPMEQSWPTLLEYPLFAARSQAGPDPRWYDNNYRSGQLFATWMHYENPALDALLDQGVEVADPVARAEIYKQAGEIMKEDVAMIHVVFPTNFVIYRDWLKGVDDNWNMAWYSECPYFWGLSKE